MKAYEHSHKLVDYLIGFGNKDTEKNLERYLRELKTGKESKNALENFKIRKALRIASNTLLNLVEIGNLYWIIKTGNPVVGIGSAITEVNRFAINYLLSYADTRTLKKMREELSQMKYEPWQRIIEDAAQNLK